MPLQDRRPSRRVHVTRGDGQATRPSRVRPKRSTNRPLGESESSCGTTRDGNLAGRCERNERPRRDRDDQQGSVLHNRHRRADEIPGDVGRHRRQYVLISSCGASAVVAAAHLHHHKTGRFESWKDRSAKAGGKERVATPATRSSPRAANRTGERGRHQTAVFVGARPALRSSGDRDDVRAANDGKTNSKACQHARLA